jgi:KaiC/GvpD/RAD55 family RecA-like ATPase
MYDLGEKLEDASVGPGTNLLVAGPPLTGKRRLAFELLAAGAAAGEGSLVVTTRDDADRVLEDYRSVLAEPERARVGVVDCVTQHHGRSASDTETVKYAASPTDMTGIGIKLSGFLDEFRDERGLDRNRVLLDSLSALLMYADLETVFRFMHAFTRRVADAEALGLYVIESTAHDDETMNTLEQLFDGVIEVDADGVTARLPGTDTSVTH